MSSSEGFSEFINTISKFTEIFSGTRDERNKIISHLISTKNSSLPDKLYHYTSTNGVAGIIQSNSLWATEFQSLNDLSELVYGTNLLIEELEKFAQEHNGHDSEFARMLSRLYKDHGDTYRTYYESYIVSFSEDTDVLSQWRAYSDNAKGFCIEFDFTDSQLFTIVSENTPWVLEILPVIYDKSLQVAAIRSGIKQLIGYLNKTEWSIERIVKASDVEQGILLGVLMHSFEPYITSFKHPGFSEEREWRAIASCMSDLTAKKKKKRKTPSGDVNYLECIFVQGDEERIWQRELLPITGIKTGPLAEERNVLTINELILENDYQDQIVITKSSIPLKK